MTLEGPKGKLYLLKRNTFQIKVINSLVEYFDNLIT